MVYFNQVKDADVRRSHMYVYFKDYAPTKALEDKEHRAYKEI